MVTISTKDTLNQMLSAELKEMFEEIIGKTYKNSQPYVTIIFLRVSTV